MPRTPYAAGNRYPDPDKILDLIEEKNDNILIAPMIPYGPASPWQTIREPSTLIPMYCTNTYTRLWTGLQARRTQNLVLNGHGGNIKTIERIGLEFDKKGAMVVMLNWWLMAWDMKPGKGRAATWRRGRQRDYGSRSSLVDMSRSTPLEMANITDNLVATGFRTVRFKGVEIEILRNTPKVTDNGWIGPDHPKHRHPGVGPGDGTDHSRLYLDLIRELKKVSL